MGKKLYLLIILISSVSMACSDTRGFESAVKLDDLGSNTCNDSGDGADVTSQVYSSKNISSLLLRDSTQKLKLFVQGIKSKNKTNKLQINESKIKILSGATDKASVKKGKKLAITIDSQCVAEKENSGYKMSSLILKDNNPGKVLKVLAVDLNKDWEISDLEAEVNTEDCILNVGENLERQLLAVPNDTHFDKQLTMPAIKYDLVYDEYMQILNGLNRNINVAIIDNGVRTDHADLSANIWINQDEISGNNVDDDNNGYIDDVKGWNFNKDNNNPDHNADSSTNFGVYHGSHVAGLAAAVTNNGKGVAGVMPAKVKIMAINVFGTTSASSIDIANGIIYAAENGADVINMSLGGEGEDSATRFAIEAAIEAGVFVVVAAGNDGASLSTKNIFPAKYGSSYQGMLTVGATNASLSRMCGFSNYSTTYVEIGAPGCEKYTDPDTGEVITDDGIISVGTNPSRSSIYYWMPGTSMASPVMAGAVALVMGSIEARTGQKPNVAVLEDFIRQNSGSLTSLSTKVNGSRFLYLSTLLDGINRDFPESIPDPDPEPEPDPKDPPKPECQK